jgi:DNA-binding winged helix-turn-helix (wHTH) protein/tetratricopeptide (TPR) repeat protein
LSAVAESAVRFLDFELDRGAHELRRRGQAVRLEGRAMTLLLMLLDRPGLLVTRGEIIEAFWGSDAFVDADAGINTAVRKLRSALGDNAMAPRIIKTVQGKGYRFVAPTADAESQASAAVEASGRASSARRPVWLRAAAVLAVAVAVGLAVALTPKPPSPPRVQVMALDVRGGDAAARAAADRLGDEIVATLNETGVQTAPPPRWTLPTLRPPPPELVVGGVVESVDGQLKARLYLSDARADLTLWTHEFAVPPNAWNALADQGAAAVSDTIYAALEPQKQKGLHLDPQSIALHIRGYDLYNHPHPLTPIDARTSFEELVRRAPDFALGHGELARILALEAWIHPEGPDREQLNRRAEAEARRAIQIDPTTAGQAYAALGALSQQRHDHWTAERVLREGLKAEPNDSFLSMKACDLLTDVGRHREALWYCVRAAALRPMSPPIGWKYAEALDYAGDSERAAKQIEHAAKFDPDNEEVRRVRFDTAALDGPPDAARRILHDQALAPRDLRTSAVRALDVYLQARERHEPDEAARAASALADETDAGGLDIAFTLAAMVKLGKEEAALRFLDHAPLEALRGRRTLGFLVHPALTPLRTDPRFWTAAQRLGLTRYWTTVGIWPDFCVAGQAPIDCRRLAEAAKS